MNSSEIEDAYREVLKVLESKSKAKVKKPKLVVVTKTKPSSDIRLLHSLGQRAFAENYVQEFLEKKSELQDLDLEWHFIGNLQRNKLRKLVGEVALIHSVDSVSIAKHIDQIAKEKSVQQEILLQISWENLEHRSGMQIEDLEACLRELISCKNLVLRGLMTVPPQAAQGEAARDYFRSLRMALGSLAKDLALPESFCELSMGMSSDYPMALEEGSTMIRLGSVILGERGA